MTHGNSESSTRDLSLRTGNRFPSQSNESIGNLVTTTIMNHTQPPKVGERISDKRATTERNQGSKCPKKQRSSFTFRQRNPPNTTRSVETDASPSKKKPQRPDLSADTSISVTKTPSGKIQRKEKNKGKKDHRRQRHRGPHTRGIPSTSSRKNEKENLIREKLIKDLTKLLTDPTTASVSVTEKSLKLLESLASTKEGRSEICGGDGECLKTVVKKLMKVSAAATEHARDGVLERLLSFQRREGA
ncbi:unnamed protein product [Brassica napus]|uniref:U-box domain-containing protein n=1 Tax=Brassica napus TaxID=3708 RepID=A0A816JEY6_BRANA|nr:unnamed protein product [Brassica napus]